MEAVLVQRVGHRGCSDQRAGLLEKGGQRSGHRELSACPFAQEIGDTGGEGRPGDETDLGLALVVELGVKLAGLCGIKKAADLEEGFSRSLGQPSGNRAGCRQALGIIHHLPDEAPFAGLVRRQLVAEQRQGFERARPMARGRNQVTPRSGTRPSCGPKVSTNEADRAAT